MGEGQEMKKEQQGHRDIADILALRDRALYNDKQWKTVKRKKEAEKKSAGRCTVPPQVDDILAIRDS